MLLLSVCSSKPDNARQPNRAIAATTRTQLHERLICRISTLIYSHTASKTRAVVFAYLCRPCRTNWLFLHPTARETAQQSFPDSKLPHALSASLRSFLRPLART